MHTYPCITDLGGLEFCAKVAAAMYFKKSPFFGILWLWHVFIWCLQALKCLYAVLPNIDDNMEMGLAIAQRVWVASFDVDENVRALASR